MTPATTQPTPTGRRGRTARDVVRGLVSLLVLLAFLVGTPLALLTISPVGRAAGARLG